MSALTREILRDELQLFAEGTQQAVLTKLFARLSAELLEGVHGDGRASLSSAEALRDSEQKRSTKSVGFREARHRPLPLNRGFTTASRWSVSTGTAISHQVTAQGSISEKSEKSTNSHDYRSDSAQANHEWLGRNFRRFQTCEFVGDETDEDPKWTAASSGTTSGPEMDKDLRKSIKQGLKLGRSSIRKVTGKAVRMMQVQSLSDKKSEADNKDASDVKRPATPDGDCPDMCMYMDTPPQQGTPRHFESGERNFLTPSAKDSVDIGQRNESAFSLSSWKQEDSMDSDIPMHGIKTFRRSTVVEAMTQMYEDTGCYTRLKAIVRNDWFDYFIGFLVVLNAVLIGVQTDVIARNDMDHTPTGYRVCESCFAFIFTFELCMRIAVYKCSFFRGRASSWNIFDFVVVFMQLLEEVLRLVELGYQGETIMANFTIARLMRVLRLVRVIRLVRILRLIRDLRTLVTSISRSMKPLFWTVVLLMTIMYLVAVYFTQLVSDVRASKRQEESSEALQAMRLLHRYYGSLGNSFLSMFQAITGGVDWDDLVDPLMTTVSPWVALSFSAYIAFVVIAFLNVVTGVFVESALKSAKEDTDFFMINNMREVFKSATDSTTGVMTYEVFLKQIDKPMMREYFKALDVDPSEARGLFRLLDMDDSGSIDAEEFLSGCLRLRGPAKALDLALLLREVRRVATCVQAIPGAMSAVVSLGARTSNSEAGRLLSYVPPQPPPTPGFPDAPLTPGRPVDTTDPAIGGAQDQDLSVTFGPLDSELRKTAWT